MLSMESYIEKLTHDFKQTDTLARHYSMDLKALRLKLRTKDDQAPA
jgi:hypothetical protein